MVVKKTRIRSKESIKDQKEKFVKSLAKNLNILTPALSECHISHQTYAKWFKTDEKFRQDCIDVENMSGDYVESKLMQLIEQGDKVSILFYLKCRRGDKWNDKSGQIQIQGSIDHNIKQIQINVIDSDTKLLMDDTLKMIDIEGKEIIDN